MLDENLGRFHFLLTFIGFNLCFAPQHWLGLNGMPRRVAEYDPQFAFVNQISSVGALLMALSTLPFLWNVFASARSGEIAGDNPWRAIEAKPMLGGKAKIESYKRQQEVKTSEIFIHHPAGHFREPVINRREDHKNRSSINDVMEVSNDEIGVMNVDIKGHLS